jgi:RecJ-like exonuclease
MNFGIEENISGSGVTYILARALSPENNDLSHLAIVGAIGDCQIDSIGIHWGLVGLNKEILKDAQNLGKINVSKGLRIWGRYTRPIHKALEYSVDPYLPGISGSESAAVQFLQELGISLKNENRWRTIADLTDEEQKKLADGIIIERIRGNCDNPEYIFGDVYELPANPGEFKDANEFATILNACGKMGKAYVGLRLCLNDQAAFSKIRGILENYRSEVGKAVNIVYGMIEKKQIVEKNCIYVLAGNTISEHIISNVISIVRHSGMLPDKPLFGFADAEDGVKISGRLSENLAQKFNLKEIMGKAAEESGGVGGGHSQAAGATIPKGNEERFINAVENIVKISSVVDNGGKSGQKTCEAGRSEETGTEQAADRAEKAGDSKTGVEEVERKGLVQYLRPG